jgi:GTP-binding protein LepA
VASDIVYTSGKTGEGVHDLLEAIVQHIPPPEGDREAPLQALIFDAKFDPHRGVIVYFRVFQGSVKPGDKIMMMSSAKVFQVQEVGMLHPGMEPTEGLIAGQVGYLTAAIKGVTDSRAGDTITHSDAPAAEALPGYRVVLPMVFAGLYPADSADYGDLKDAIDRFALNDPSFSFAQETSAALGFGFRCGFLGLLHMEIVQERLEREFGQELIASAPSVEYRVVLLNNGGLVAVDNPSKMPNAGEIEEIQEPWVKLSVVAPSNFIGALMELATNRRGTFLGMEYLDPQRVLLTFELPLGEVIVDFYDQLKSRTQGYASMDYEESGYRAANLVKVDVLVAGEPVDALSVIVHRDRAQAIGRELVHRLRGLIPRQMFEIAIQAAIGSNVIARETVAAMRKNVLAKCYGGDISRKRKLLDKQKEGKQRMKRVGSVEIPQEAFLAVLRMDDV